MLMCFLADYADKNGNFLHRAFQTMALTPVDKYTAAMGACDILREQGFTPLLIIYVPGTHSMEELEEIAEHGPTDNLQPLYAAKGILDQMKAR